MLLGDPTTKGRAEVPGFVRAADEPWQYGQSRGAGVWCASGAGWRVPKLGWHDACVSSRVRWLGQIEENQDEAQLPFGLPLIQPSTKGTELKQFTKGAHFVGRASKRTPTILRGPC